MTKEQADESIIKYWEDFANDLDKQAAGLEKLADIMTNQEEADWTRLKAKHRREEAEDFRQMAKKKKASSGR